MPSTRPPSAAPNPPPSHNDARHCSCGHGRDHHLVSAEGKYNLTGWFWVLFGVTTKPVKVQWRCRKCGEVFDESTDEKDLKAHS